MRATIDITSGIIELFKGSSPDGIGHSGRHHPASGHQGKENVLRKRIRICLLPSASLLLIVLIALTVGAALVEVEQISPTYPMKKVTLKGSYYDIGFQLGSFARASGAKAIEMTDADREQFLEFKNLLEEVHPPIVEELRGIWAAFGLDYDDAEFVIDQIPIQGQTFVVGWYIDSHMLPFACSAISLSKNATQDREVLFARNFDWQRMDCSIVFMHPEDAYPSVGCTPYDVLSMLLDGMNSEGLKVSVNAAYPGLVSSPPPPNILQIVAARVMIDKCASVDEAIDFLERTPITFPVVTVHYLIADRTGQSAIVEFLGNDVKVVRPENDYQVMTNSYHCLGNHLFCWRYQTAARMIKDGYGEIDDDYVKRILQSVRQANTQWSVIYRSESGKVLISLADKPTEFYEFTFDPLPMAATSVEHERELTTVWGKLKVGHP
jgi:predicted choloylglycine hydrolase